VPVPVPASASASVAVEAASFLLGVCSVVSFRETKLSVKGALLRLYCGERVRVKRGSVTISKIELRSISWVAGRKM
jgi:hypothetical protein